MEEVDDVDKHHPSGLDESDPILLGPTRSQKVIKKKWKQVCQDILNRVPDQLPPLREINHHVPLVDDQKKYNYYLSKCPD